MKNLIFDAKLNLKSEPNVLIVCGTLFTDRMDDTITLEKAHPQGIIETVLILNLTLIEGKETKKGNPKPFIYNLNNIEAMQFTHVTIVYGLGESKTQIVKIIG